MTQSILKVLMRAVLRVLFKFPQRFALPARLERARIDLLALGAGVPPGQTSLERLSSGGVPVTVFRNGSAPSGSPAERPAILYAHGGAFVAGSARSHRNLIAHLAHASRADVHLVEYRLAPEHPYPAPVDDLFAAYRAMLERGHDPSQIAIGGDSAGAALAVSTALAIREMGLPQPAALVLLSPWVDLSLSGASASANAARDPVLMVSWLERAARSHADGRGLTDSQVSPLYADLHGLPPTLIQVGEDEVLLDDAVRFADRAWAAGVEVQLERFPGLWHDFQVHAGLLDESDGAIGDIAGFLRRRWAGSPEQAESHL